MKQSEAESYLKTKLKSFYLFSYFTLPDELQAGQLVIDALNRLYLEGDDSLDTLVNSEVDDIGRKELLSFLELKIFSKIREMGQKRVEQLALEGDELYFNMDWKSRTQLYLHSVLGKNFDFISTVFDEEKLTTQSHFYQAMDQFEKNYYEPLESSFYQENCSKRYLVTQLLDKTLNRDKEIAYYTHMGECDTCKEHFHHQAELRKRIKFFMSEAKVSSETEQLLSSELNSILESTYKKLRRKVSSKLISRVAEIFKIF